MPNFLEDTKNWYQKSLFFGNFTYIFKKTAKYLITGGFLTINKMHMKKLAIFSAFACALALALVANPAQASSPENPGAYLEDVTLTPASMVLGATTTYTLDLTLKQDVSGSISVWWMQKSCGKDEFDNPNCAIGLNNASLAGDYQFEAMDSGFMISPAMPEGAGADQEEPVLSAGDYTFVISGAVNPSLGTFQAPMINVQLMDEEEEDPCEGENCPDPAGLALTPLFFDIAFKGRVLDADSNGVANTQVMASAASWWNGSQSDNNGWYGIPNAGDLENGEYMISASPESSSGLVGESANVTYAGSVVTQNISVVPATKIITGFVKYSTGAAVTDAQVWANAAGQGGSGMSASVGSDGSYTVYATGGAWEVGVNAGWNEEGQQESVDWYYDGRPTQVNFADDSTTETARVGFTVEKAPATATGKVVKPSGAAVSEGSLEFRNKEGQGNHGDIQNGNFSVNLPAGEFSLSYYDWGGSGEFYLPSTTIVIAEGANNLGTLTLKKKTSHITGKIKDSETGNGIADIRVGAWMEMGEGWAEATTNADGNFDLLVFAGTWQLDAGTEPGSEYITAGGPPRSVAVANNQTKSGNNFTLTPASGYVDVTLLDPDGDVMTDSYGWAYCMVKGGGHDSELGGNLEGGKGTIPVIGGKTYQCNVGLDPWSDYASSGGFQEVAVPVDGRKSLSFGTALKDGAINGTIKDRSGAVVKNLEAEIFGEGDTGWIGTRVEDDGTFTLKVISGSDYRLGIWAPGGEVLSGPPDQAVTVPSGKSVNVTMTVTKANAYVSGTILDPDGNKVDHAFVVAGNWEEFENKKGTGEETKPIETGTDAYDGAFTLPLYASDAGDITYEIFVTPQGKGKAGGGRTNWMPPAAVNVTPTVGETVELSFQYSEADATLSGTATGAGGAALEMGFCHAWAEEGGGMTGTEMWFGGETSMEYTMPIMSGKTWYVGCDAKADDNSFYRSAEEQVVIKAGDNTVNLTLEKESFVIPEPMTTMFSPNSPKTVTLPDGTVVTFPAGVAETDGMLNFVATPSTNLYHSKDAKPLTFAWNFELKDATGQAVEQFNRLVYISIPYDPDILEEKGIDDPKELAAKYFDENSNAWLSPSEVSVDVENHTVTFSVNHFSEFALVTGAAAQVSGLAAEGPYNLIATAAKDGGPQVGVYDKDGNLKATWFAYTETLRMGIKAVSADLDGNGEAEVVTYPTEGLASQVRVFDKNGTILSQFFAHATSYTGGIDLTTMDLDGDGEVEIITSPTGEGQTADVRVYDRNGTLLAQFSAMNVPAKLVASDLNADGTGEIVVYPTAGSGHVRIFDKDGNALAQFHAYGATYNKGVNLVAADMDGDGTVEIITGTKESAPQVKTFDRNGTLIAQFMGYAETFRGGVVPEVGDLDGDGTSEIMVLPGTDGAAQARVFDKDGNLLSQFFGYPSTIRGSFEVVVADLDGNAGAEITFAPQEGLGPQARVFDKDGNALSQFFTLHTGFRGGIHLTKIVQ